MYLIVGLGNPEPEYEKTRHNMGFKVINKIAQNYQIDINRKNFNGMYGSGIVENEKVILLKPQTYMNLSGNSVAEFINFYKIDLDKVLIIYDDIDIEPGKVKLKRVGSAGTHNGMKSVIEKLGNENFARLRIGIGMPKEKQDLANYVLSQIDDEDKKILEQGIENGYKAAVEFIKNDIDIAMNKYN